MDNRDSEVDLTSLILGFSSAVLSYLGIGDDTKKPDENSLTLAKQNIDILLLLREKTKGNLTLDESQLINDVVKDLMNKYAEVHGTF